MSRSTRRRDAAATKPLPFGILGTGRMAAKLTAALHRCGATAPVAVGSRDPDRAQEFAGAHAVARHGDYAAVVDDPGVEVVYLALPPHRHREWTERAAAAGRAVLCEKPLAATADDAEAMAAACRAAGVPLLDGTQWTRTPRAAALRERIRGEEIRRVTRVTSAFSFRAFRSGAEGPTPGAVLPDAVLPDEGEHRLDPARGGGALLDLGWYCVHAALWACGADAAAQLARARPLAATLAADPGEAEHTAAALLDLGRDRTAGFDVGYRTAYRNWVEIAGEHGSLVVDRFTRPRDGEQIRFWHHGARGDAAVVTCDPYDQAEEFLQDVAARVRTGEGDEPALELALVTQRVLDAVREAGRHRPSRP